MNRCFQMFMELETREGMPELCIDYTMTPRVDATYWQPAEGGEIEIDTVTLGCALPEPPLSDAEWDSVHAFVHKYHDDENDLDQGEDEDAYNAWRDDRLTGSAS